MTEIIDIDAEQALLGALLVRPSLLETVATSIRPEHFGEPLHGEIYAAIISLAASGTVASIITLAPAFQFAAPIGDMPVKDYLGKLMGMVTSLLPSTIAGYAGVVRATAARRRIHEVGAHLMQAAGDASVECAELASDGMRMLDDVVGKPESCKSANTESVMRSIRERKAKGEAITGIPTGFLKLDEMIDGLRPATITIIGARPKQGKTAFLLSIIRNLCKSGVACKFFSLEMPADQIIQRLIAMEASVNFKVLTRGKYDESEGASIDEAAAVVSRWPLLIDDATSLTPSMIGARARGAIKSDGSQAVFIDYLQRVSPEKGSKRYEEVTSVSMAISDLRKTLNVPIVCAAQLNRKVADRSKTTDWKKFSAETTRPNDGDLRDSGQIEQDADALIFINRPGVFLEMMKPTDEGELADWENARDKWRVKSEVAVHYNRSGETGILNYRFHSPTMRWDEEIYEKRLQSSAPVNYIKG
jgi:replicative DNA helicase